MATRETAAAKAWREYDAPDPDSYWHIFRGERHVYGPDDWFQWEIGKMPEGYVLLLKYFTWGDAWDLMWERIPSEKEALEQARFHARLARLAYRKSQKKHDGRADGGEVYLDVERALRARDSA